MDIERSTADILRRGASPDALSSIGGVKNDRKPMRYRTYLPTQEGNKFKRMETGLRSNAAATLYALVKREHLRKSLCAFILSIHFPHQLSTG